MMHNRKVGILIFIILVLSLGIAYVVKGEIMVLFLTAKDYVTGKNESMGIVADYHFEQAKEHAEKAKAMYMSNLKALEDQYKNSTSDEEKKNIALLIASYYETGKGVEQSSRKAKRWMEKAKAAGANTTTTQTIEETVVVGQDQQGDTVVVEEVEAQPSDANGSSGQ